MVIKKDCRGIMRIILLLFRCMLEQPYIKFMPTLVSSKPRLSKCRRRSERSGVRIGDARHRMPARKATQGIYPCTIERPSSCDRLCRQPPSAPFSPLQTRAALIEPDRCQSRWFRKRRQSSQSRFRRSQSQASTKRERHTKTSLRP